MNKVTFKKQTFKEFVKTWPGDLTALDNNWIGNHCYICKKELIPEEAWFVYYIGLMCGSEECDTMLLLQYSEYLM
jgi:hypothetical protein